MFRIIRNEKNKVFLHGASDEAGIFTNVLLQSFEIIALLPDHELQETNSFKVAQNSF